MAQLWGGRFTKETNAAVKSFNDSLAFDSRLYYEDITGSIAHAAMLGRQGIISQEEADQIRGGLRGILMDIEKGALVFEDGYEDIHSFVEAHPYRQEPQRPGGPGYAHVCPQADGGSPK